MQKPHLRTDIDLLQNNSNLIVDANYQRAQIKNL